MIRVNLVPGELLGRARQRQLMLQGIVLGGLLVTSLLVVGFFHWFGMYRLEQDKAYKESKLQKLAAIVAQVEELEKAATAVRARLGVIEDLLKGRPFYPIFMSEFVRTVPAGVRIMGLNTSTQGVGALRLQINAQAATNEDIAAWVRTLEGNPRFKGTELGAVSSGGPRVYSFSIVTNYNNKL